MIYNKKAETMPRQEIEELQLARLKKIIRYCMMRCGDVPQTI